MAATQYGILKPEELKPLVGLKGVPPINKPRGKSRQRWVRHQFSVDGSQLKLIKFVVAIGRNMTASNHQKVSLWQGYLTYQTQTTLDLTEFVSQCYSMQHKLQLLTLGAIAPVLVRLVQNYVYDGSPPFSLDGPTAKQLKKAAVKEELTEAWAERSVKMIAYVNSQLPETTAEGQAWLEVDKFLRDLRNPIAHSDAELKQVTKAQLLGLASADQISEEAQPFVKAAMNMLSTLTSKDQPLNPNKPLTIA